MNKWQQWSHFSHSTGKTQICCDIFSSLVLQRHRGDDWVTTQLCVCVCVCVCVRVCVCQHWKSLVTVMNRASEQVSQKTEPLRGDKQSGWLSDVCACVCVCVCVCMCVCCVCVVCVRVWVISGELISKQTLNGNSVQHDRNNITIRIVVFAASFKAGKTYTFRKYKLMQFILFYLFAKNAN